VVHLISEIISELFLLSETKFFLFVYLFRHTTLDYVSVSAQMQLQNAMWLRRTCWLCGLSCRSAAISFLGSRVRTPIRAWIRVFCVFVCFEFSGLCDELVIRSEESYTLCLCLTVCVLGTSTRSHPSPQFDCSTTESNIKFTYGHSNWSWRLVSARRQCGCFSRVGLLYGTFQNTFYVLKGIIS
jgi:hypothetical protein